MTKLALLLPLISCSAHATDAFLTLEKSFAHYSSVPSIEFQVQRGEKTESFRSRVLKTLETSNVGVGRLGTEEFFILGATPDQKACLLKFQKAQRDFYDTNAPHRQARTAEYRISIASVEREAPAQEAPSLGKGQHAPFMGLTSREARIYIPGDNSFAADVISENGSIMAEVERSKFVVNIDETGKVSKLASATIYTVCERKPWYPFEWLHGLAQTSEDYKACLKYENVTIKSSCSPRP